VQHLFNNRIDIQRKYLVPDDHGGFTDEWANLERLNISSLVGTFVKHETITGGTSGATAKVGKVGEGYLEIYERSSTDFEADEENEEITGTTSKATADIDKIISLANIACRLQPLSGRELFTAGKETVFASHRLFIAVPPVTITEKDRAKKGTREFGIELIKNWNEANRFYRLDVLEIE